MRVATVHYHLRPGGVTRVMENAVASLGKAGDVAVVVLSGESGERSRLEDWGVVDGLSYEGGAAAKEAGALADGLERAAEEKLGAAPDLWHFHNHNLGKNAALPEAVTLLAERGHRLLLQMHDFPEDGRPANYAMLPRREVLYPLAANVHYACLNSRDRDALASAGVPGERLHLLPNPVSVGGAPGTMDEGGANGAGERKVLLYPTRAIRRKNLGEVLLLAAAAGTEVLLATTAAPENPVWLPVHDRWAALAAKMGLPVEVAVVNRCSPKELGCGAEEDAGFESWMHAADAMVTTSVAEGFGLAFLEPLLIRRPLMGRDLPEITADMKAEGLEFPGLYEGVEAPLDWVGEARLRGDLREALERVYEKYGRTLCEADVEAAFGSMVSEGRVEFGRLGEGHQEAVIEKMAGGGAGDVMVRREDGGAEGVGSWLERVLGMSAEAFALEKNGRLVEEKYSLERYGDLLMDCYAAVTGAKAGAESAEERVNLESDVSERLLDFFLDPKRFCFLRA